MVSGWDRDSGWRMDDQPLRDAVERCLHEHCAELSGPLLEVCRYAVTGGRRTRALLLFHAAERADAPAQRAACALEMLHAATLLQDDIFDRSDERRGRPAAHVRFGKSQTILASDWLLVRALELAVEVDAAFFRVLAHAATSMARTVAREVEPGDFRSLASAEQYLREISSGKTAVLFSAALFGAALLRQQAGAVPARWQETGSCIGRAFQLLDDCMDVYAAPEKLDKSSGQDLISGRLTLPLLFACRRLEKNDSLPCLERLANGQLTLREIDALRGALQEPEVRRAAEAEALKALTCVGGHSRRNGVPAAAVAFCTADLHRKMTLCFAQQPAE